MSRKVGGGASDSGSFTLRNKKAKPISYGHSRVEVAELSLHWAFKSARPELQSPKLCHSLAE